MNTSRRGFLKITGLTMGSYFLGRVGKAHAYAEKPISSDAVSMLVDTTMCIGCRTCEMVCSEVNNLPEPLLLGDESVFERERTTSVNAYTVVNRYETEKGIVYAKKQCMHCNQPACASACLVKAMLKTTEGAVIWRGDNCMGCRYCMISCPFDIPKFEYKSPNPRLRKCIFCYGRLREGQNPACAESCPAEALLFGKRAELLEIAKTRIYQNPDKYVHHIYGEHEVGGTGWLYLSSVPFEQLGFRNNLGTTPYPELTKGFLYAVLIADFLLPMFMLGLSYAIQERREAEKKERKGGARWRGR